MYSFYVPYAFLIVVRCIFMACYVVPVGFVIVFTITTVQQKPIAP